MINDKSVFAVIMAGGKGTRIGATDKPKVMFELNGKPIISYAIDPFLKLKSEKVLDRIITVVGFLGNQIVDYLGDKSEFVWQKEQLGTAHAVRCAEELIGGENGITIITNGDHALYSVDTYRKMLDQFFSQGLTLGFAVVKTADRFDNYGRVIRGNDGAVVRIAEPPEITEEESAIEERSTNIYVVDNKWLFDALSRVEKSPVKNEYYINSIVKMAIDESKKVEAIEIGDVLEATGINTQEDRVETEKILTDRLS